MKTNVWENVLESRNVEILPGKIMMVKKYLATEFMKKKKNCGSWKFPTRTTRGTKHVQIHYVSPCYVH